MLNYFGSHWCKCNQLWSLLRGDFIRESLKILWLTWIDRLGNVIIMTQDCFWSNTVKVIKYNISKKYMTKDRYQLECVVGKKKMCIVFIQNTILQTLLSWNLKKMATCLQCFLNKPTSVVCTSEVLPAQAPCVTCWAHLQVSWLPAPTTRFQSGAPLCPFTTRSAGPCPPEQPVTAPHNPLSVSLLSLHHCPSLPPEGTIQSPMTQSIF